MRRRRLTAGLERDCVGDASQIGTPRWFVVRDTHAQEDTQLVRPRTALTWMRGPMTPSELVRARRVVG